MNPTNEGERTEMPTKSLQDGELKPENPKTATANQGLQNWLGRYMASNSSREDSGRPSKKQKTSESPTENHSDQSSSKISENSTKENKPTKEAPTMEIDEDSEQVKEKDSSQSDDKEVHAERTLRDRSKIKTLRKSLAQGNDLVDSDDEKKRHYFSSDDDSDYVADEPSESDEEEDYEVDDRKDKWSPKSGMNTSFKNYSFSKKENDKVAEKSSVNCRSNVMNGGTGQLTQFGSKVVHKQNDSSAANPLPEKIKSNPRKSEPEYSVINSCGLKLVYGVEYRPNN